MKIEVIGGELSDAEINEYAERGRAKYGSELEEIDILVEGEDVELTYHLRGQPFERIRRITGYLVGTTDRWNDAKQAEEKDRVKHRV